jgi:DNA-binding MarR family transcriptional regulator
VGDHVDAIVEQWERERPDLDVSALALFGRLFRAAHLADSELAVVARASGLGPGWFDLLAALRRTGAPYALNPTELIRTTMLSSGGMTKRIDRLSAAGLVERLPDPSDRRGTLIRLTAAGLAAIDEALPAHVASEERLLAPLTAPERRSLDRLLRKLVAHLDEPPSRTGGRRGKAG